MGTPGGERIQARDVWVVLIAADDEDGSHHSRRRRARVRTQSHTPPTGSQQATGWKNGKIAYPRLVFFFSILMPARRDDSCAPPRQAATTKRVVGVVARGVRAVARSAVADGIIR